MTAVLWVLRRHRRVRRANTRRGCGRSDSLHAGALFVWLWERRENFGGGAARPTPPPCLPMPNEGNKDVNGAESRKTSREAPQGVKKGGIARLEAHLRRAARTFPPPPTCLVAMGAPSPEVNVGPPRSPAAGARGGASPLRQRRGASASAGARGRKIGSRAEAPCAACAARRSAVRRLGREARRAAARNMAARALRARVRVSREQLTKPLFTQAATAAPSCRRCPTPPSGRRG